MAKVKTAFFCSSCGQQSSKWVGKCPVCDEWNTMVEEIIQREKKSMLATTSKASPKIITQINQVTEKRIKLPGKEINRVLGGGLVAGSLVLFGGEPGIGKSTLMLQLVMHWNRKVLYVSGEESDNQIKMRADRIGSTNENCYLLTETNTENIFHYLIELQPELVVIDSIQTLQTDMIESSAGSISQIKECTSQLQRFAKETNTPIFLIGHITKEGSLAGPKVLEHIVDTVLQFEGERNHIYRLLRSTKNRFGATNELGIFEMTGKGLIEVSNPSDVLISHSEERLSGIAIGSSMEGLRPLLIEVQALVSSAAYGTPQRSATGFDLRRLSMLLAVLEKRCRFKLGAKDVFLNMAGGIKVNDPATDLAIVSAILSSNANLAIDKKCCMAAEVGLAGEIRPVGHITVRIKEAQKLGFETFILSKYNKSVNKNDYSIKLVEATKIEDVVKQLFG